MPVFQSFNQTRQRLIISRIHQFTGRKSWEAYGHRIICSVRVEEDMDESMFDVRVVFRISLTWSLTTINGTSSLFQAMCQLVSEGLVSVPAPCSEATDWPVNRPRHFHLLGHLSKTHHQLPQTYSSAMRFPQSTSQ